MISDHAFTPCQVTAYNGHQGDERPSSMIIEGRTVDILHMRSMRIEEDVRTRVRKRFFAALGSDGREYLFCHDGARDLWSVRQDPA